MSTNATNADRIVDRLIQSRNPPAGMDGDEIRRIIADDAAYMREQEQELRESKRRDLTVKIHLDMHPHQPEDTSIYDVAEEYGDLKFTGSAAYANGWRIQKVHDIDGGQRRRDLWVAVNVKETHGTINLPSSTVKELAKSIAQEWAYWADGSVYGYTIEDGNGDDVDSCWGFYGVPWNNGTNTEPVYPLDYMHEAIKEALEHHHQEVLGGGRMGYTFEDGTHASETIDDHRQALARLEAAKQTN